MKQKYDWKDLKLQFFQSDIDEVKEFFQRKFNVYNRNIQQNTRGWTKEKQEYKEKILEKALERKAKEEAKNLEISTTQLKQAKKTLLLVTVLEAPSNLLSLYTIYASFKLFSIKSSSTLLINSSPISHRFLEGTIL
jgi:hypothetical protein